MLTKDLDLLISLTRCRTEKGDGPDVFTHWIYGFLHRDMRTPVYSNLQAVKGILGYESQ